MAIDALLIGIAYYLAIGIRFQEWEKSAHRPLARPAIALPDAAARPAFGDTTQPSVAELGHS